VTSPEGAYYDHDSLTLVTETGVVRNHMEIRPGTVGVEEQPAKSRFAWGVLGGIYVKNELGTDQRAEVLNMLGQHVASPILQTDKVFIPMRAGAYIIRVGDRSTKVVVY
jgi:hypothetical protein